MFGKLTLSAIPFDQPIIMGAGAFMALVVLGIAGALTKFGKWKWLWTEWLTSVDHKRIGVMYIVVAVLMLVRGFIDAVMMRAQQAIAYLDPGFLPPHHYDQIFTAHGVIMIFFMAMALMVGFFNLVVPLQIGARDVAFPFLNSLSFWMTAISRDPDERVARRRRICAGGLACLSAVVRVAVQSGRRGRLLHLEPAVVGDRHAASRRSISS